MCPQRLRQVALVLRSWGQDAGVLPGNAQAGLLSATGNPVLTVEPWPEAFVARFRTGCASFDAAVGSEKRARYQQSSRRPPIALMRNAARASSSKNRARQIGQSTRTLAVPVKIEEAAGLGAEEGDPPPQPPPLHCVSSLHLRFDQRQDERPRRSRRRSPPNRRRDEEGGRRLRCVRFLGSQTQLGLSVCRVRVERERPCVSGRFGSFTKLSQLCSRCGYLFCRCCFVFAKIRDRPVCSPLELSHVRCSDRVASIARAILHYHENMAFKGRRCSFRFSLMPLSSKTSNILVGEALPLSTEPFGWLMNFERQL